MTRNYFDKELLKLHRELTELGRRVDESMSDTLFALKRLDREAARGVVEGDDEIDGMENQIEQMCMNLICRQQPMAGDLRVITATLKLITDVERIADQCADIGEILIKMGEAPYVKPLIHLPLMLDTARSMFARAIKAYITRDVELAKAVCMDDNIIDDNFSTVVMELCNIIAEKGTSVRQAVDLLLIAKYIERIGDHTTNIAEWVIFMATGEHLDLNVHETPAGE